MSYPFMFLQALLRLEIGPHFLSELWDVLARQALEFHSLMYLTALTCRFPYVQWSCIIILCKYCVVAAQICKMGADEV